MVLFMTACTNGGDTSLTSGGLYSIDNGDGTFGVAKILVLDEEAAHIRTYKGRFPARPDTEDLGQLSVGSIHDGEDFGMGHLPLTREAFLSWRPQLILVTSVTSEELEGYEVWKEAGGGLFQ
jgi:hypothetical protein